MYNELGMTDEKEMLEAGFRTLTEYGIPLELEPLDEQGAARPDARIRLTIDKTTHVFDVECKKWLKPGVLGNVATKLKQSEHPGFLVADYVNPRMAERLRELDIPFVDMTGNAWLELPPIVIRVEGNKPEPEARGAAQQRLFRRTGLKVIFALQCRPELFHAPTREIAEVAGVANGAVGWALKGLREEGYLIERGKGRGRKRTPRKLLRLLDEWAGEYARTLRPTLVLGRYAPGPKTPRDWWNEAPGQKYGVLLGGEPAAGKLTDYLQPGTITFYAEQVPGRVIAKQGLRRDENGEIEFRRRFWPFEHEWGHPDLVPPALIYADLLATDEARCVETARKIHEQYLAGPLGQY